MINTFAKGILERKSIRFSLFYIVKIFVLKRGCREMTAIRKGGVTHFESHHPKFLHKKRWLTITIFLRYML